MKKCYCCGAKIELDTAAFCPKCGKPLEVTPELTRRAAAGDSDAQTELYYRTYAAVYARIRSKVPDDDTAMDLMQDTYLRAFSHLEQLNEPAAFPGWILTIARNLTINWYKKHSKEKTTALFSESEFENEANLSAEDDESASTEYRIDFMPEESLDRAETARLVSEILDELPEEQKIVLLMRYTDEMSIEEIAEELGVSPNTVKTRLLRAKKKVETKVLELERKGTKLYSLAPLPFLLFLLGNLESQAPNISATQVLGTGAVAGASAGATAGTTATTTAATSAGTTAATTAAATAGGVATKGLAVKIIAALLAVALVGGGGAAAYSAYSQAKQAEEDARAAEMLAEEEAAALAEAERQPEEAEAEATQPEENAEAEVLNTAYVVVTEGEPESAYDGAVNGDCHFQRIVFTSPNEALAKINLDLESESDAFFEGSGNEYYLYYNALIDVVAEDDTYLQGNEEEYSWYCTMDVESVYIDDEYVSVVEKYKWYVGGVDNTCYYGYNYDITTGERISVARLFNGNEEEASSEIIAATYAYGEKTGLNLSGYTETIDNYPIDDYEFYFDANTIYIVYQVYEIGSGADGTQIVELSRNAETTTNTEVNASWEELYADYLELENTEDSTGYFYLIYLNDDDVPEAIYISVEDSQNLLFYIQNGEVKEQQLGDYEVSFFVEKGVIYGSSITPVQDSSYPNERRNEFVCYILDEENSLIPVYTCGYNSWHSSNMMSNQYYNQTWNGETLSSQSEYQEKWYSACTELLSSEYGIDVRYEDTDRIVIYYYSGEDEVIAYYYYLDSEYKDSYVAKGYDSMVTYLRSLTN